MSERASEQEREGDKEGENNILSFSLHGTKIVKEGRLEIKRYRLLASAYCSVAKQVAYQVKDSGSLLLVQGKHLLQGMLRQLCRKGGRDVVTVPTTRLLTACT